MASKKKFPDLTGDGKVTKKDILKGRGVAGFEKGGKVTKTEKTAASEDAYETKTKSKSKSKSKSKHRDPGADDRMKEFEKSAREAGFANGGMVKGYSKGGCVQLSGRKFSGTF